MQPVVLHAHFYQPERANPWTNTLDPEPSAAPHRDWNERIHRESYRANAIARIFDGEGRVEEIVNNYEWLSFNFGPTLLGWMAARHPDTYERIRAADRRSQRRTGHGNAIAQAFHHTILPLANERDRRTQVAWGLADFRARFGRDAEGLWLPETAANDATLETLIDAGVAYTILAPGQAAAVSDEQGVWHDVHGRIDTARPYRFLHRDGSGRSLAVFFYDGALAQGFAFDPQRMDAGKMTRAVVDASNGPGLVHAAMDGETFGHHHRFGELGLAYMFTRTGPDAGLAPTNYGAYLAGHPPSTQVRLVDGEGSAWSCAHGVGRWIRDCGCQTSGEPHWNQRWRGPLRTALDLLRDDAAEVFANLGAELLTDPWAARDAYVEVVTGTRSARDFLAEHGRGRLDADAAVRARTLLESQRHAMAMYTSCGWFFADVSGIETVYVLRFAARVLDLLDDLGVGGPRTAFLDALADARSNRAEVGSAVDVWYARVLPDAVPLERVAAHATLLASAGQPTAAPPGGHTVDTREVDVEQRGGHRLATGLLDVTAEATGKTASFAVAGLYLGGLDVHATVAAADPDGPARLEQVRQAWARQPLAQLLRTVDDTLGGKEYLLEAALPEGRQALLNLVGRDLERQFSDTYLTFADAHHRTLEMLREHGYDLPPLLRAAAEHSLSHTIAERILTVEAAAAVPRGDVDAGTIRDLVSAAHGDGVAVDAGPIGEALETIIAEATARACETRSLEDTEQVLAWLALAEQLKLHVDTGRAQERLYALATGRNGSGPSGAQSVVLAELGGPLGLAPRLLPRARTSA